MTVTKEHSTIKGVLRIGYDFAKENKTLVVLVTASIVGFSDTLISFSFDKAAFPDHFNDVYSQHLNIAVPTIYYTGIAINYVLISGILRGASWVRSKI